MNSAWNVFLPFVKDRGQLVVSDGVEFQHKYLQHSHENFSGLQYKQFLLFVRKGEEVGGKRGEGVNKVCGMGVGRGRETKRWWTSIKAHLKSMRWYGCKNKMKILATANTVFLSTKTADKQTSGPYINTLGREIKSLIQMTDFELMTYIPNELWCAV